MSDKGVVGRVAILYHPKVPASRPLASEIADWLAERGQESWIVSTWDEAAIAAEMASLGLLVVLGGDGSILRAARLAAAQGVPLFSVNLGRVGFLSEATPENWPRRLAEVLDGRCWLEKRLMVRADWERDGHVLATFTALNDVVVSRGAQARVVRLELYVDDDYVTTYTADGLIVATPTGSTAYSMAAGGPILPPELKNFLVMPVAAHLSLDRALVLHEMAEISILVHCEYDATLTADGQAGVDVEDGDRIIIGKYAHESHFARVDDRSYFYHSLLERLGLTPRKNGHMSG